MIDLIFIIVACTSSASNLNDAEALRRTTSTYGAKALPLTIELAQDHVVHACVAGELYNVDDTKLLAIAHHESRNDPSVATNEGRGYWWADYGAGKLGYANVRWSCGVATPWPHPWPCEPWELEIGGGYLAAARHLRVWMNDCRDNEACALAGYSGHADDHQTPGYKTWQVFLWRAAWIKRERSRAIPTS
jgi:hypothetical protein